jgi:predicted aminopeptidase
MRAVLFSLIAAPLAGCSSLNYYRKALVGQLELMNKVRPIETVINDESVPVDVRRRLEIIKQARSFAVTELKLPDNNSYRDYADLQRPYAMWSVFATPPYSLAPVKWCYPFVGCYHYRSYFNHAESQSFAQQLQEEGFDTYVAGVPAYSTLGWFDDPVINTMMHWEDYDLVGTLFHELAHQQLHIANDTTFNESFARAVEQEGLRRWMVAQQQSQRYQAYQADVKREQAFVALILQARNQLEVLYQTEMPEQKKFIQKLDIFRQLRARYFKLRESWGGVSSYDHWILSGINNAKVQSIATYYDYVPGFKKILADCDNDMQRFYHRVAELTTMDVTQRRRYLLSESLSC